MTRLITLIATGALAAAVLFRFSPDYRLALCILVSLAAIVLAVQSFSTGKIILAFLLLGVLAIFTPFRSTQFSHGFTSVLDLATLALFGVMPWMLRRAITPAIAIAPQGKS